MIHTIDDLINQISTYKSVMSLTRVPGWPSIRFSNTGRRGIKEFEISLLSLEKTFIDIRNHFPVFESISNYDETPWRTAFGEFLTDPVVNALSTVQTLPLYSVIHKFLCAVNDLEYIEKQMPLTEENLDNTIGFLNRQVQHYTANFIAPEITANSKTPHTRGGENIIYYGAPGTGKSHAIDEQTDDDNSVRTVFHPETQYSDFVGCLKPSMNNDSIEYSFKHGPFIEALVKALKDPEHHYYLIIEEINRAPAAAVFGELFQLLDRDPAGKSKYKIDINDRDLLTLLTKELSAPLPANKLYIPENLSLYATMNSSDQAVMPLDTAFKRRWKFEYKPLDFTTSPLGNFELNTQDGPQTVSWSNFAQVVNSILSSESIPEDRHMGPWFVNENEIKDPEDAKKALTGKILMYLWDDVLRHSERSVLFHQEIKTFGSLVKKFNAGEIIFSENFEKRLKEETGK
ncbi:AAA family ATPase [Acinetobacter baumannii]|uniref:McrB family protein n=1 Tax=Acinetobacter baumannii TaxID=470 RepID=UPI00044E153F|nr:AAA family ATPase [Acinetobacter baumannii]EXR46233.1 AAA domain family protein [Acinetobacter baumannii 1391434]MDH2586713.1 AAA family ATPase [Acinetobacter baumannii]RIL17669.1 type II restriction endonuclease subunit R [Acinetobacter baumannii]